MTPDEYLAALRAAGIPDGLPAGEIDRRAATLLGLGERTTRRYRLGAQEIPKPIRVALRSLSMAVPTGDHAP